jgi:hypothetical protein
MLALVSRYLEHPSIYLAADRQDSHRSSGVIQ